jgi:hypothetical protein
MVLRLPSSAAAQVGSNEGDNLMLLRITAGPYVFTARMEEGDAPQTCAAFRGLLPWRNKIIQARWSGEAAWIPLGDFQLGVGYENHTKGAVEGPGAVGALGGRARHPL